jgi:cyanophycinase
MRDMLLLTASMILLAQAQAPPAPFDYVRQGEAQDAVRDTKPGYVLMGGGGDVAAAFSWMIERANGGDFLVLRAAGSDAYNPFVRKLGPGLNSVATLILRTREASDDSTVLDKIKKAEAIFFAGGDQWNYVSRWKGTGLARAVQERIQAGVPVGGTSAGLAILGQYVFSAERDTVTSEQALGDPYHEKVTITSDFLAVPFLDEVITDSHFMARGRMGRLVAFVARIAKDQGIPKARGIGIDEATAVLLQPDGTALIEGKGSAYFVETTREAEVCEPGQSLTIRDLSVYKAGKGGRFDIPSWKGTGGTTSTVSARAGKIY